MGSSISQGFGKSSLVDLVVLGSFGFFTFSPISSFILINLLHFPVALPELFFLAFYFFVKDKLDLRILKNRNTIYSFSLLFFLLLISSLYQKFDLVSIISTFRGYLYVILSFVIFRRKNFTSTFDILTISIGTVVGWLVVSLFQFRLLVNNAEVEGSMAVYGNLVGLSLVIIIPIFYNLGKIQSFSILLGLILSFTSGIRRQIFIYLVSLVVSFLLSLRNRILLSIKIIIISFFLFMFLGFYYSTISEYFYSVSPHLHYRVFVKSEVLLEGDLGEGDSHRANRFSDYYNSLDEFIFPRGFVSKRTNLDSSVGIYLDFPLLELSFTFGIFILFFLFISYFYFLLRNIFRFFLMNDLESGIWSSAGFILFLLLFLDGGFLNFAYVAPFTGLVIGKVTK